LEPLSLADEAEVQITVDTEMAVNAEEILRRAGRVYHGFTDEDIAQVEAIALDRQHFFREPAA
jgi:glycerol-3-phosphate dehydrogenase